MLKRIRSQTALCLFIILFAYTGYAQNPNQDTTINYSKGDSAIMNRAYKNKLTFWLFKNIYQKHTNTKEQTNVQEQQDNYDSYSEKVIRTIYIKVLNPFGTNVNDTSLTKTDLLGKMGNTLNIRTRRKNIRYQLLFKKGDRLDPLKLRESERLLRRQEYIHDAKINVINTNTIIDSVDIVVIVQDRWALNASGGTSTTSSDFRITESNFLGTGNKVEQSGIYDLTKQKFTHWSGIAQDINIRNTYINGSLFYNIAPDEHSEGIRFERFFYSPLTKWAGAISTIRYSKNLTYTAFDSLSIMIPLKWYSEDFWIGRSFPFSNYYDINRNTSVVLTGRISNLHYLEKPNLSLDPDRNYQHTILYLGSVGFSTRRYYKDKKIFRFGNVEDVPEGRLFALVGGYQKQEILSVIYTGVKFAAGEHIKHFGYLSGISEYGTFYNDYLPRQAVFNTDITYFSDLWNFGRWNFRQFVYLRNTNGINRMPSEYITINGRGSEGLYGFNSTAVGGRNKTIIKFESIFYMPVNVIGIQVATVVFAGFGKIGDSFFSTTKDHTIYQAYGLGFLLRKENLVLNTIRISLGYYPNIPKGTGTEYRFNPFSINNLNIRDFDISKPDLISYY